MLWIWMLACGTTSTEPPPAPSPRVEAEPQPEPTTPKSLSRVSVALMEALVSGERPQSAFLDPRRGLVVVEVGEDASGEDPRAGEDGVVRTATHSCGDEATAALEALRADLAMRMEQAGEGGVFTCKSASCTHPALMEYDKTGEYVFRSARKGLVLDRVVRIEGNMSEAWTSEARAWADEQLKQLRMERCGKAGAPAEPMPAEPVPAKPAKP